MFFAALFGLFTFLNVNCLCPANNPIQETILVASVIHNLRSLHSSYQNPCLFKLLLIQDNSSDIISLSWFTWNHRSIIWIYLEMCPSIIYYYGLDIKCPSKKGSCVVSRFQASGSIERWLDHEANGLINGLIHRLINSWVDYPEVSIVSGCWWISHWDVDTDQDVYTDMDKITIKYNQVSWKY